MQYRIWLWVGALTFAAVGPLATESLDAVFANAGSPPEGNEICDGDGTGAFDCSIFPGDPFQASKAATGDLDGDGHFDIVFASFPAARSCLGDGTGQFVCTEIDPPVGGKDVALGFIDGDSALDAGLVLASFLYVCIGDGSGGFSCSFVGENEINAVTLGHLDGDSHLDVVLARGTGFFNRVCSGDGLGGFSCSNVAGTSEDEASDVAIGMFDQSDDIPDLIFANSFEPNRLCFGTAGGVFLCSAINQEARVSRGLVLGDFNEDGDLDAVFANDGGTDASEICLGDGAATLSCSDLGTLEAEISFSEDVVAGHLDGDNHLDLLFANDSMANRVCLGNGRGNFSCSNVNRSAHRTFGVALGTLVVELIFADGFESGDVAAWSSSAP